MFYRGAWKSLAHGTANMDVLVVLGTSTAYFYSVAVLCAQLMNPAEAGHVCFEASAMLITFLSLGRTLECQAKVTRISIPHHCVQQSDARMICLVVLLLPCRGKRRGRWRN